MEARVSTRGRVTIPVELRRRLGIKPGTRILIEVEAEQKWLILTPITRAYIHSLRGKYRGRGMLKALMADRRRERLRER